MFGPVGFAAGALLGSFLFGQGGPDVEGPRLGDLNVTVSSIYGGVIPKCYAVQKVAGQIIWATDIVEDKNTKKVGGGLFGGGQKVTEYRYYANFAVLFAEGECEGLLRLWVGEKLIADFTAPAVEEDELDSLADAIRYFVNHRRYRFRFYRGTADQEPDPLIVKHVERETGANATPGFRDVVYLVFERLPLDEFGNRIPPVTAEIAWRANDEQPIRALRFIPGGGIFASGTSYQQGSGALDPRRNYFYARTTASPGGIRRFNLLTGEEAFQVSAADGDWGSTSYEVATVDLDGNVYMAADTGNDLLKVDGDSLVLKETGVNFLFGYREADCGHAFTLGGFVPFVFAATTLGSVRIVRAETPMMLLHSGGVSGHRIAGVVKGREELGECDGWYAFRNFPSAGVSVAIRRYTVQAVARVIAGAAVGLAYKDWVLTPADFGGSTNILLEDGLAYDENDDSIIFIVRLDDGSQHRLVKFSGDGEIVWTSSEGWGLFDIPRKARITRDRLALWRGGSTNPRIRVVDTTTGSIVSEQIGWDSKGGETTFYDADKQMLVNMTGNGIFQAWPGRVSRDTVPLGSVVTDLCARVGLAAGDLDTSELTDGVRGYGIARQVSVRGALELLAAAYHFDGVESDYQLKFRKRGRSSVRVIAEDELIPVNAEGEAFVETRAQDVDLPVRFTVRYNDPDRDLDVGTQAVKRIIEPSPTVQSRNEATLDLPLTLTAKQAKEVALRQGFSPWLERIMHEWALDWTHVDLDPGDVVTFALNDGRLFTVRILRLNIGANLQLQLETVVQDSSSYEVTALADGGQAYRREIVAPSDYTQLILADSPLLEDGDDAERSSSGIYWAIGGIGQPGWRYGLVFESMDGAGYYVVDESTTEMIWGVCSSALGDTALPYQTDRTNTLQVSMTTGTPGSVTDLEMLGGANRALVIDADGAVEVIAWANATHVAGRRYLLDTFLRGLRGTENFTGGHAIGSIFLVVDEAVLREIVPLAELGQIRHYKAVGQGGTLGEAARKQITPTGRDLMPYRPVHLASNGASWGSSITLSWVRQTRLGGEWVDSFAGTPLAEDAEAYELEILAGPGGNVLRTATGIASPSFVYTTAMQSADFAGAQTALTFRVYQISAQVGRGCASEDATVDVT